MRHTWLAYTMLAAVFATSLCFGQQLTKKITNSDVVEMVAMGLSDDVIIDKIHTSDQTDFDTSIAALKALKEAKVSDAVIRAMINPKPAAVPATPASGNTVTAPVNTSPNDPNAPHDAGIYMYATSKNGLQMSMLEPTVYSQGKSGGVFKSAMTYGIAKMKWKAVVRGAHANVRSSDPKAVFYFYFEETSAGLSHASFGGTSTPNEFTLVKFEAKSDTRETVVMKANAFGSSSGTDEKATVSFTFAKLRPGVYKVVPNAPLKPGEYCFLGASGGGVYGAGAAGANRLFDFGVSSPE